jgi:hypothetical protein
MQSVTQGEPFTVTWDPESHPTDGVTVSLVLCHGPGSNCVLSDTAIAEGIPAGQKSYDWNVPCDLAPGVQSTSTGYGMLIIVDGTGEFQCKKHARISFDQMTDSRQTRLNSPSSRTRPAPGAHPLRLALPLLPHGPPDPPRPKLPPAVAS